MRKKLFLKILRNNVSELIADQPITVHRFVLYSGDAVSGPLSWSWAGSWVGRLDPLGREVWFTQFGPATSNVAKRSWNLVIPYSTAYPVYPAMDDKILLYDHLGTLKGTFRVNFIVKYEIDGSVWKVDANLEQLQP